MDFTTPEPPPAEKQMSEIRIFSFVPRLGLQATGSGTYEQECEGTLCDVDPEFANISQDFDLKTAIAIGADFMFKLGELFRIGPGLFHTFTTDVELSNGSQSVSQEAGSLTEINFVAEAIPRVSGTVWLVPRLQVGAAMFSASGPLKTVVNSWKDGCSALKDSAAGTSASVTCSNYGNPHLGFDVGAGFGAMFAVAPAVRLRADALYEYFSVGLGKLEVSGPGGSLTHTLNLSGSRFVLMGGVEF